MKLLELLNALEDAGVIDMGRSTSIIDAEVYVRYPNDDQDWCPQLVITDVKGRQYVVDVGER